MKQKKCKTCNKIKSLSEFAKSGNGRGKYGLRPHCKICWALKVKLKERKTKYQSTLKREYGITLDDYNKMFVLQEGCCAICGKHQSEFEQRLCVDHCHSTGIIRGLLCHKCNLALAGFNEDVDILQASIIYLDRIYSA